MEEAVVATLEGIVEAFEYGEEPLVFWQGEQDSLVILGSNSGTRGGAEVKKGGEGRDELLA